MASSAKLLLNAVSPQVRKLLVRERIRAMAGGLDESLNRLNGAVELVGDERVHDVVALVTLKAELLHYDRRHAEALKGYCEKVLLLKTRLEIEQQFAVEQNLADLEFSARTGGAGDTFYSLVDRQRMAGFEWSDSRDLVAAHHAAAKGRHFDALPLIWRTAVRAHLQGCWLANRWAMQSLAGESLQLGALADAAYYAIACGESEIAGQVADEVLRRRDGEVVRELVTRLLKSANLRMHFSVACDILVQIADAVPDDQLSGLADWLLPRCADHQDGAGGDSSLSMAWKALEPIAHRLPPEVARRAVDEALAHPLWTARPEQPNAVFIERQQIVRTVNRLAAVIEPPALGSIAEQTLPLALHRHQSRDYPDVINLLCHAADRGGAAVKAAVGKALFPPGKSPDRLLVQVLSQFQDSLPAPDQVAEFADHVTNEIQNQVQIVPPGETAVEVAETLMTSQQQTERGTLVVKVVSSAGLHGVARLRRALPRDALVRLIRAIICMANERENFITNRTSLVQSLLEFADVVDDELRSVVYPAIEKLARGEIEEPESHPTEADAANPLNPNKMRFGRVSDLRSIALVVYAEFARFDKARLATVSDVLEEAIYDPNPDVRRGAFAAVARLPEVSDTLLLAVLLGAIDPDPSVATAAFFAMSKQSWKMKGQHWQIFIHGLRLAAQSDDTRVRRNAAAAARRSYRGRNAAIRSAFQQARSLFEHDICESVRRAARRDHSQK